MAVGVLTLRIHLPGCSSLKEKRGRLKPLLARLHLEFNLSVAEIELQDTWQSATIQCALVNSSAAHAQSSMQRVVTWIEANWSDVEVIDDQLEII